VRTGKRERTRLLRAELWMQLAVQVELWARQARDEAPGYLPFDEWERDGKPDPFHELLRTYDLTADDLARACHSLAGQLETRAMQAGYEEAWS